MNYYVFKGRFQPFHNGHLQIVQRTLEMMNYDDVLIIATLYKVDKIGNVDHVFYNAASEHLLPERNPWGPIVALEAIAEVSKMVQSSQRILTTMMPFPNLAWDVVKNLIPVNRVWVIPNAGEAFDDVKADFYTRNGESVIRVLDDSKISGKELRDYYFANNVSLFSSGVPPFLNEIYWPKFCERL